MKAQANNPDTQVKVADQSNDWLIKTAQEIANEARKRSLLLPITTAADHHARPQAPQTKESISLQLVAAYKGYQAVVEALNSNRSRNSRLLIATKEEVAIEFESWLTEKKLFYITTAQHANPQLHFTLVATPNVIAAPEDIIKAAESFGQDQSYEAYVWDELFSTYTAEQLSGTHPSNGNAVMFSLIPNKTDEKLTGTVAEQRARLVDMQATNSSIKVPSALEAVTYWYTLRMQAGKKAVNDITTEQTYIRHFNLPEQQVAGWSGVPYSYVGSTGRSMGRVAVG